MYRKIILIGVIHLAIIMIVNDLMFTLHFAALYPFLSSFWFLPRNSDLVKHLKIIVLFILPVSILNIGLLAMVNGMPVSNIVRQSFLLALLFSITLSGGAFLLGIILNRVIKQRDTRINILIMIIASVPSILAGAAGWPAQFSLAGFFFITGGFISYILIGEYKLHHLLTLILPLFLLMGSLALINNKNTVYPIVLIIPISALIGYGLARLYKRKKQKIFYPLVIMYLLFLGAGYAGMENWVVYVVNRKYQQQEVQAIDFKFYKEDGTVITPASIKGKVSLFYFWSTTCGVCYKKFPEVNKLYKKYKDHDNITFYTVNVNVQSRDTAMNMQEHIRAKGYAFQVLEVPLRDKAKLMKSLKFNTFPYALLIDPDGKVLHRGLFTTNPWVFIHNMDRRLAEAVGGGVSKE
ncbi:MAG: TlpA family protein disulfide reductase [Bacteroidales bacterium]|nr:TlpA family protein disulfide reductase [Bacteroidales bacterium]